MKNHHPLPLKALALLPLTTLAGSVRASRIEWAMLLGGQTCGEQACSQPGAALEEAPLVCIKDTAGSYYRKSVALIDHLSASPHSSDHYPTFARETPEQECKQ